MEHETTTILLALLCIGLVFAFPPNHQFDSSKRYQYCGSKLSSAISVVCNGYYNTLIPRNPSGMPFISPNDAKAMLKRRRRGITDECCYNSCTLEELRTFCGQ